MSALGRYRVIYEVADVVGSCPIYKKGDKVVIDPAEADQEVSIINLKETDAVCTRILGTTLLSYFMFFQVANEEELHEKYHTIKGGVHWSRCTEPGKPYTKRGYVTFRIYREPYQPEVDGQ